MLYTSKINLYQNLFYPPEGYQIDWVEITTWSLAKDFLRIIPAMIFAANSPARPTKLTSVNKYVKLSKKEEAPFHIFYDNTNCREQEADTYYLTPNGKYALYMLEKHCTGVTLKEGLFHPKIILIQYKKKEKDCVFSYLYRVCISSKNLTWSNYLEAGVILQSQEIINDTSEPSNDMGDPANELCRFFKKYYENFDLKKDRTRKLIYEKLQLAKFNLINNHNIVKSASPVKLYFNKEKYNNDCLLDLIINDVSQYKDKATDKKQFRMRIVSMNPQSNLWKTLKPEYKSNLWKALKPEYICNFKDIYEYNPPKNTWVKKEGKQENFWYCGKDEKNPFPLHIKQYLLWLDDNSQTSSAKNYTDALVVWMGSANCSCNGLNGRNEEVLVRFESFRKDEGCLNGGDFPCKGPGDGYIFAKRSEEKIICFSNNKVKDPLVQEDEDEEASSTIDITLQEICYDRKERLHIKVTNNENDKIIIKPATLPNNAYKEIESKKTIECDFEMTESQFGNILIVKCKNMSYSINMNIPWEGKEYENLVLDLPVEPLSNLYELIEYQPYFDSHDDIFERIAKCKLMESEEKYKKIIKSTQVNLESYKNDVPKNDLMDSEQIFITYEKEVELLKTLLDKELARCH